MNGNVGALITSFNQERLLQQAVDSVLGQSVRPDKLIIIDDGSEDNSRSLIESYRNSYPRIIESIYHEKNMGVSTTRRDGLNRIDTRFVTYLDGDDLFSKMKIEKELEAISSNKSQIVYSDNYYIDQENNILGRWAEGSIVPEGDVFRETFSRDFPHRNLFRMEMIEYSAWTKIGFHDPNLDIYEDFDMRIRLTKLLKTSYIDMPLSSIRLNTDGLSKRPPIEHVNALNYIFKKNKRLLKDLESQDARLCRKMYSEWILRFIRRAARQAWDDRAMGDYLNAQILRLQYTGTHLWNAL